MFVLYAALVIISSLNRETGVLLVMTYAAVFADGWRGRAYWLRVGVLAALFGGTQAALHLAYGSAPHPLGIAGTLGTNLAILPEGLFSNVLFVPLWVAVALAYRRAPTFLKRLVFCAALYGVMFFFGGLWREVRLWLTVFPLVVPLIVRQVSIEAKSEPSK